MPAVRNRSRRNARGAGWHRRGYRDYGNMWIQVAEGSDGAARGMEVNENETLAAFIDQVECSQETGQFYPHQDEWSFDLFYRGRSLIRMQEEHNQQRGIFDEPLTVSDLFDGGETVYFKVYDEDGQERCYNGFHWEYYESAASIVAQQRQEQRQRQQPLRRQMSDYGELSSRASAIQASWPPRHRNRVVSAPGSGMSGSEGRQDEDISIDEDETISLETEAETNRPSFQNILDFFYDRRPRPLTAPADRMSLSATHYWPTQGRAF